MALPYFRPDPKRPTPTHVYVMAAGDHVKIGLAENPERRRVALQCACPLEIRTEATMLFATFAIARAVEKELHSAFADRRGFGEWFAVPVASAALALMSYADMAYISPTPEPVRELTEDEKRKARMRQWLNDEIESTRSGTDMHMTRRAMKALEF